MRVLLPQNSDDIKQISRDRNLCKGSKQLQAIFLKHNNNY